MHKRRHTGCESAQESAQGRAHKRGYRGSRRITICGEAGSERGSRGMSPIAVGTGSSSGERGRTLQHRVSVDLWTGSARGPESVDSLQASVRGCGWVVCMVCMVCYSMHHQHTCSLSLLGTVGFSLVHCGALSSRCALSQPELTHSSPRAPITAALTFPVELSLHCLSARVL